MGSVNGKIFFLRKSVIGIRRYAWCFLLPPIIFRWLRLSIGLTSVSVPELFVGTEEVAGFLLDGEDIEAVVTAIPTY
jgi:hypothetical protein